MNFIIILLNYDDEFCLMVVSINEKERDGKSVRKINFWMFIDIFIFILPYYCPCQHSLVGHVSIPVVISSEFDNCDFIVTKIKI